MDDTDRALIARLRDHARESFTDLAKHLGVSEGTVRARMKRLVDNGTIRQFTIRTAGADMRALVEVSVAPETPTESVAQAIGTWDGVEAVWEITGDMDLLVVADCPTTETLNTIIDRIRKVPGAASTRSRLILREHA